MEIFSIILVALCGIFAGICTGLIPGIHINLISSFILVNIAFLLVKFEAQLLIVFIIVMSLTHTFIDFIPSLLFGVPDPDTALSVLPGHVLVLKGEAYKAVFLSAIGSLFGVFSSIVIAPVFFLFLDSTYDVLKRFIPYLLLFTVFTLIVLEKSKNKIFWAFIIVLFSGGYGMLILNSSLTSNPLLLLFSGCFGVASLAYSLNSDSAKIPIQHFNVDFRFDKVFFKGVFVGSISSSVCSVTPGIGNAQAGTLSSLFFKLDSSVFIVVLSVINTINFVLSLVTFYIIDRARNGSIYAISQFASFITFNDLIVYFVIILVIAPILFFITLFLGKRIIRIVTKFNFRIVNVSIIVFLFVLVYVITDLIGILIMVGASALGLLCLSLGVRRVHMMSVLIVPVILNLI